MPTDSTVYDPTAALTGFGSIGPNQPPLAPPWIPPSAPTPEVQAGVEADKGWTDAELIGAAAVGSATAAVLTWAASDARRRKSRHLSRGQRAAVQRAAAVDAANRDRDRKAMALTLRKAGIVGGRSMTAAASAAESRKFGGRNYHLMAGFRTKHDARRAARDIRWFGSNARVVPIRGGHAVYSASRKRRI